MKRLKAYFLFILVFILTGCSKSIDTEQYDGKNLSIGVIGQAPEVREKN